MDKESTTTFRGNDRILFGFICGLLSFWLFAMTLLNVRGEMNADLGLSPSMLNLAVSVTSLVCGILIVLIGGLGDRLGHTRMTRLGLILAIVGAVLIALTPGHSSLTAPILLLGRICQGLSGACVMPSTLALLRVFWDEKGRQRAISLWSMGTWGGTAFSSLLGGYMTQWLSWRWIFWLAAAVALLGLFLIRTLPYYRPGSDAKGGRDIPGIATLILGIVSLQLYVTEGPQWGWVDVKSLGLLLTATIFILLFIGIERGAKHPFLDLRVFRNPVYSGATVANFLLNASTGIIIIVSSLLQLASGVPVDQVGLMSIGYGVSILLFIRVGEKLMQRYGARLPMLLSCGTVAVALCLLLPTNAMAGTYMTLVVIAYSLFGAGLGLFATASTDSALATLPESRTGIGSGIFKMASSLGSSFGIAISTAIFQDIAYSAEPITFLSQVVTFVGRQDNVTIRQGAMAAYLYNLIIIVISFAVIYYSIPKGQGKTTIASK